MTMTDKTERTEPMPLTPINEPKRFTKTELENFEAVQLKTDYRNLLASYQHQSREIERLTAERDDYEKQLEAMTPMVQNAQSAALVWEKQVDTLRAELSAAREAIEIVQQCNRDMALLNDSAHAQLSAANEARERL